jgi:hypothetical protein
MVPPSRPDTSSAKVTVVKGPAVSDEVVFYSDDYGVRVTNTRLVIMRPQGTTTYSMANITSISMRTTPANRRPGLFLAFLGLAIGIGGLALGYAESLAVGIPFLIAGIAWAALVKPTYRVRVSSAAAEEDVMESKAKQYIQGVVNAVNEAFIKRG